jgi:hypothetical protein
MMNGNSDLLRDAVAHNAKSIDTVLWAFVILELALIYLKLNKKGTFIWGGLEANATGAWPVAFFFLLTLAHLFTTLRFTQSVRACLRECSVSHRLRAFLRVTSSGGLFMRGMIPRTQLLPNGAYKMEGRDLTTIPSYVAAFMIMPALIPFDSLTVWRLVKYLFFAWVLIVINWRIGSLWAVTLSRLAKPEGGNIPTTPTMPFKSL